MWPLGALLALAGALTTASWALLHHHGAEHRWLLLDDPEQHQGPHKRAASDLLQPTAPVAAEMMVRTARGNRPYDVPQIGITYMYASQRRFRNVGKRRRVSHRSGVGTLLLSHTDPRDRLGLATRGPAKYNAVA
ncbi:hypothetical protein AAG570_008721 [Ranatra chinensis]|uniref:Uncharacterized protein n=1 Tax=Ranatra chinensis TaxID=642074 RepID=A0ABD0ZF12_9HEMI